jgi:MoxR-like ATPase
MGYPAARSEIDMLERHADREPLEALEPVSDAATVRRLIGITHAVYAADAVKEYVVNLVRATRTSPDLRLGASPRAALHLLRASKAHAAMSGRNHVLPDDVQVLAHAVLAHRLLPSTDAQLARRTPEDVVAQVLAEVPVPRPRATA